MTGGVPDLPRLVYSPVDRDAARIRVLDDHRRGQSELAEHAARALEVDEVVVRQLLASELLDLREQVAPRADLAVVRGGLVWVLAVREVRHLAERERELVGEPLGVPEPVGDRRLVHGRRLERLLREP